MCDVHAAVHSPHEAQSARSPAAMILPGARRSANANTALYGQSYVQNDRDPSTQTIRNPHVANVSWATHAPGRMRQKSLVTKDAHPSLSPNTRQAGAGAPAIHRLTCGQMNM
jgi:hypothetical protein